MAVPRVYVRRGTTVWIGTYISHLTYISLPHGHRTHAHRFLYVSHNKVINPFKTIIILDKIPRGGVAPLGEVRTGSPVQIGHVMWCRLCAISIGTIFDHFF